MRCVVEPPLTLINTALTLLCEPVALVGKLFACIRNALTLVGDPLALVGDAVSSVCATLMFSQLHGRRLIRFSGHVHMVRWNSAHHPKYEPP